jgi:hypothetical protein
VNSYAYFFLGPVIVEIFIAACLALAFMRLSTRDPATLPETIT